jgi:hypothetical protein
MFALSRLQDQYRAAATNRNGSADKNSTVEESRTGEANVQQWLIEFLSWLGETPLSLAIAQSEWMFPAFEVVHIFAISMVFGTIAIIDLRLLGVASANRRYTEMAHELLPWTWGAWVAAAVFGTLLMASRPAAYFANADYRLKFLCMGLAAINMLVFQFITSRDIAKWDKGGVSLAGRVAGGLSLVLWIGVIYFARKTGYTLMPSGAL